LGAQQEDIAMRLLPTRPLEKLKRYDERRKGFAGEHWLTLGAGLVLLMKARRSRSPLGSIIGSTLGSALLYRAASGRGGLAKVLRYLPIGRSWR
jgi:uncharacterized membrane protein